MRISILFLATACAGAAVFSHAAPALAEEPDFRGMAKSSYGDDVCSTVIMTANPERLLGNVVQSIATPRNSACVLLQSFVRMPGAKIASREVVAIQGNGIAKPSAFALSSLPNLRKQHGEVVSLDRVGEALDVSRMGSGTSTKSGPRGLIFGGKTYDFTWSMTALNKNPVTNEPYAVGANGHLWTPEFEFAYPVWNGAVPDVRAIDSKGRLLVVVPAYDRLYDVWVDRTYVGRFSDIDRNLDVGFSEASSSAYYPGYVMTLNELSFDSSDRLVIYRQEGRVFTRTSYEVTSQ